MNTEEEIDSIIESLRNSKIVPNDRKKISSSASNQEKSTNQSKSKSQTPSSNASNEKSHLENNQSNFEKNISKSKDVSEASIINESDSNSFIRAIDMRDNYARLLYRIDAEIEKQKYNNTVKNDENSVDSEVFNELSEWNIAWEECILMATKVIPYKSIQAQSGSEQRDILIDIVTKLCQKVLNVKESEEYKYLKNKHLQYKKRLYKIESKYESLYSEVQKNRILLHELQSKQNQKINTFYFDDDSSNNNEAFFDSSISSKKSEKIHNRDKKLRNKHEKHKNRHKNSSNNLESQLKEQKCKIKKTKHQKNLNDFIFESNNESSASSNKNDFHENLKRMMGIVKNIEKSYHRHHKNSHSFDSDNNINQLSLKELEVKHNNLREVENNLSVTYSTKTDSSS